MRLMIVTYPQKIRYYLIAPRTGIDTKDTSATENYVLIFQVFINKRAENKNHVKVVLHHV